MNFWWNLNLTTCVLQKPILKTRLRNCDAIVCFILHRELSILLTHLPLFACCCTAYNPRLLKKSLPLMSLSLSFTTVKQASSQIQSLWTTLVAISPITCFGLSENVLRSLSRFVVIPCPDEVFLRILLTQVFVMTLHTLLESIIQIAKILPYWIFVSSGWSWFAASLEMAAT